MQKRLLCWILALCMAFALVCMPAQAAQSNELTIYFFLRTEVGCNEAVACGILANIEAECGFNPEAYNPSGGYYGICQWGSSRKQRLKDYCHEKGLDYTSLEGQLEYLHYELQTNEKEAWTRLQSVSNSASGAYDAAIIWAQYYERCSESYRESRGQKAKNTFWPKYHGYDVPDPTPTSTPAPTPTPVPTVGGFEDVKQSDWYADAVVWAVNAGITTGKTAKTFAPKENCTRAQIVTFLWRAMGCPSPKGGNPFTDVKDSAYFKNAVIWAEETGITTGTSSGKFSPNDVVTRGQTVTFLYRLAGEPAVGADNPFHDIAAGKFYTKGVLWAVQNGITNGATKTTFEPNSPCTRAQIVTFLHRDMT